MACVFVPFVAFVPFVVTTSIAGCINHEDYEGREGRESKVVHDYRALVRLGAPTASKSFVPFRRRALRRRRVLRPLRALRGHDFDTLSGNDHVPSASTSRPPRTGKPVPSIRNSGSKMNPRAK